MKADYDKKEYDREVRRFKELTTRMYETFKKKRNDYGPSTRETWEKYGPISMLVRMDDKMNRFKNLAIDDTKRLVEDESIKDTLLDLANYALITILELEYIEVRNRMKSVVIYGMDVEADDED